MIQALPIASVCSRQPTGHTRSHADLAGAKSSRAMSANHAAILYPDVDAAYWRGVAICDRFTVQGVTIIVRELVRCNSSTGVMRLLCIPDETPADDYEILLMFGDRFRRQALIGRLDSIAKCRPRIEPRVRMMFA